MTRIIAIADSHGMHDDLVLPEGDILVHAGDWSNHGTFQDLVNFNKWLGSLDFKHIVCIAGNHDIFASQVNKRVVQEFLTNATYLENEGAYIDGVSFWGSPFTPLFGQWAFMKSRGDAIAKVWAMIPQDLDVLITHGPAQGVLDTNARHELCGCYDLRHAIQSRKIQKHVFGHIHNNGGQKGYIDSTVCINASVLNDDYEIAYKPMVFDV
jgi:Icc-related predicted phosphoesterase